MVVYISFIVIIRKNIFFYYPSSFFKRSKKKVLKQKHLGKTLLLFNFNFKVEGLKFKRDCKVGKKKLLAKTFSFFLLGRCAFSLSL